MITKGTVSDLLEGCHMPEQKPMIFAYFTFDQLPDIQRMYHAVLTCADQIPILTSRYEKNKNRFVSIPVKQDDIIKEVKHYNFMDWDLTKHPQIQLQILSDRCELCIGISHIICDGAGFKQLLYIFCRHYNDEHKANITNMRYLKAMKSYKHYHQSLTKKHITLPHQPSNASTYTFCVKETLKLEMLHKYTQVYHVTINELVMSAYILALYDLSGQTTITLPCPVDLRKFINHPPEYSITNFTGEYMITVVDIANLTMKEIALNIHRQMYKERQRNSDLRYITLLQRWQCMVANRLSYHIARHFFKTSELSYTNLGIIDDQKLVFKHCVIRHLHITGRYRMYPSFQLNVSTFHDILTLSCSAEGTTNQQKVISKLIRHTASYLTHLDIDK